MKKKSNEHYKRINFWPTEDRPREKLFEKGEHTLSNSELLAILLRTGTKGQSAIDLARSILKKFKSFRQMSKSHPSDWQGFKGLGLAKIAQLKAAVEIGRRFVEDQANQQQPVINAPEDIVRILMPRMRDLKKEIVKAVFLDSQNKLLNIVEIEEGTVNYSAPIIREIFERALQNYAISIVCVHNHPSGDPFPSEEDRIFTNDLCQASKILQIHILDHIIIGNNKYYSFADMGDLKLR